MGYTKCGEDNKKHVDDNWYYKKGFPYRKTEDRTKNIDWESGRVTHVRVKEK